MHRALCPRSACDCCEVEGDGWYDREFGGSSDDIGSKAFDAWTWFAVQLSDNTQLSVYHIFDKDSRAAKEKVAVYADESGQRQVVQVELSPGTTWTSMASFIEYPTQWDVVVPGLDLKLKLTAAFAHQEFNTVLVTGGGFFEGRMHVEGTKGTEVLNGLAFLEKKNFTQYQEGEGGELEGNWGLDWMKPSFFKNMFQGILCHGPCIP